MPSYPSVIEFKLFTFKKNLKMNNAVNAPHAKVRDDSKPRFQDYHHLGKIMHSHS